MNHWFSNIILVIVLCKTIAIPPVRLIYKNAFFILLFLIRLHIQSHNKNRNRLHSTSHPAHESSTSGTTTPQPTSPSDSMQKSHEVQSTTIDQFSQLDLKHKHLNLSKAAEKEISSCFGKIKTSLSLNSNFRTQFDKVVKVSRLDQIESLISKKVAKFFHQLFF